MSIFVGNIRERAMGFYSDVILPRLCDLGMRNKLLLPIRERVIGAAEGRVLEIGVGSGLNLPFYRPAAKLVTMAQNASRGTIMPVSFLEASAEAIPLVDHSVDTIVTTWTMCSIPHAETALAEIRRVLRPGGKLLFAEHGLPKSVRVGLATPALARSADTGLALHRRRLSPQPADQLDDRKRRFSDRPDRDRVYSGTQANDLHV